MTRRGDSEYVGDNVARSLTGDEHVKIVDKDGAVGFTNTQSIADLGGGGGGGSDIPLSYLDPDVTLAANSDTKIATQKATKAYADSVAAGGGIPLGYLDTDGTLAANSDVKVATQKATKTYADTKLAKASNLSDLVSPSSARTNLGLGTIATQAASAVAITGGSITGITDLAVADGGTGASTASAARTNLGLGTVSILASDVDGMLAANSDLNVATQKATKTYADTKLAKASNLSDLVNPSSARTNLGLGTIATQDAASVAITGGSITGITDLLVADGGTGASTASGARTNLGLGTIAVQDAASVSITGGSITGITDLTVADGGTGASTASGARTNLGLGTVAVLDSDTDGTLAANSDLKVATQKAVKTYVDALLNAQDAMVFKGVIDCSANPNYPAANAGYVYKVSVAGKIGGASGVNVEIGDTLYCITDSSASGDQATVGPNWVIVQTNIDGAVTGPASSTSGDLASFNGTGGKVIQDSGLSLDTDVTLAANSDSKIASQKATKAYADTKLAKASNLSDLVSPSSARTNLGLGTIAVQDAASVSITGGSITGITDLTVADGGTGASTASGARTNLGLGTAAVLDSDTDGTLAANSDLIVATQKATKTYADTKLAKASNLSDLVSPSSARTNLGLGTIATQDAASVSISGGSITGITDLAVADGGTGASTAANARTNLGLGSFAVLNSLAFTALSDTFVYTSNGSKLVAVNAGATALEAVTTVGTPITFPAGTFGSPGICIGEAGTGLYLVGAGILGWSAGGAAAFEADSARIRGKILSLSDDNRNGTATGLNISIAGTATFIMEGQGTVGLTMTGYAGAPTGDFQRTQGTRALATVITTSAVIGQFRFRGFDGSAYRNSSSFSGTVIAATPSATDMQGRFSMNTTPAGSVTVTETVRLEFDTGLSMYGANVVLDQNRIVRMRSYTAATIPTATTTGLIHVSDADGGPAIAYADGTSWRRLSNGAVITATVGAEGLLSKLTSAIDQSTRDGIRAVYQGLNDAGLFSKLKGLWFHAMPLQADALINWITPGTRDLTITGTPTFTANRGFTGDGATALLSGVSAFTVFGATVNDTALGVYILTPSVANAAVIGITAGTRQNYMQSAASGALNARLMDSTSDLFTPSKYAGMFTMSRQASTGYSIYLDSNLSLAITRTSVAGDTRVPCFLGTTDTTGSEFSTAQIAFSFVSTGLSAQDVANLYFIMYRFLTLRMSSVVSTLAVNAAPYLSLAIPDDHTLAVIDKYTLADGIALTLGDNAIIRIQ